jgi:molecular chaperone DnaK (HSP70)
MAKYLGIDLGTTYTQACLCEHSLWEKNERFWNKIRFADQDHNERFPSMVFYPGPNEPPVAGEEAEKNLESQPEQVLKESKSRLLNYDLSEDYDLSDMMVLFPKGEQMKQAAWEVSSIILNQAIAKMEDSNDKPLDFSEIRACTITFPASFPYTALGLTKRAANMINELKTLNENDRLYFLPEPIAAFIGMIESEGRSQFQDGDTVLVVDIGAGTTDTTIIEIQEMGASFQTLKILEVGDHILQGGNNYDMVISEFLCKQVWPEFLDLKRLENAKGGTLENALKQFRYQWDLMARNIKEEFVEAEEDDELDIIEDEVIQNTFLDCLDQLAKLLGIEKRTKITLKSKDLNDALLKAIGKPTGATLLSGLIKLEERYESSQEKLFEPSSIILAGGGAKVKAVQLALEQKYEGVKQFLVDNPQDLIARGAAIYSSMSKEERELLKWPINQNVYLVVQDRNGKETWDNIWNRDVRENEYPYRMSKTGKNLLLKIGTGFFDKKKNIDRVISKDMKDHGAIKLRQDVQQDEEIKIRTWVDSDSNKPYMEVLLKDQDNWFPGSDRVSLEFRI